MPLQLTTPKTTGDLDPNALDDQYTQLKIVAFKADLIQKTLTVDLQYGNTVDGDWVPGILPHRPFVIINKPDIVQDDGTVVPGDPQYNEMMMLLPSSLELSVYQHVANALYQWLIDEGYVSGTVIP